MLKSVLAASIILYLQIVSVHSMQLSTVIQGITKEDIQAIFTDTLRNFKESKTRIIYLDASYLYNFHLDDFEHVKKFNILGRYDIKAVLEWHKYLERWFSDQTVTLGNQVIKPIQIERTFDRVVNEGMESLARTITGSDADNYDYRAIGIGEGEALPSDQTLISELNRIDVFDSPDGGSLSADGSTIYSIGNHPKSVESADITECGMLSNALPSNDLMFEHSMFQTPITHVMNADAVGSTTVVYMCSS